jgi:16S rRNA (cytosine967-C5)-methyltransferase
MSDNARTVALRVLLDCRTRHAFVQEILDDHLHRADLSPADRRLTTQLAYGVLRRRGTLDALLRPLINRPPEQVEPWLWEALRLGAYQLALLTQVPPHAAIHETVELATAWNNPKAKGFLNGVLRSLSRLLTDERTTAPAADALPLEDGSYRRLAEPLFADPKRSFADYLAAAFALPDWLAQRWVKRSSRDDCVRLGFWFATPPPLWLRCNLLRTSREECLEPLRTAGIQAEPGAHPQSIRLNESKPVREVPGFAEGRLTVQDESAMWAASALAPAAGSSVLDLCAAPGGKTTHLAELMGNTGHIVACDVDGRRLANVSELAARLGINIIETCLLASGQEPPCGPFDAVLVDVPCSNTGVLGRRPEARWRLREEDIRHLTRLQGNLLRLAIERCKTGGTIVYSTCSIEPEENGLLVRQVLRNAPMIELEAEEERRPGLPADGGYWARLRRK